MYDAIYSYLFNWFDSVPNRHDVSGTMIYYEDSDASSYFDSMVRDYIMLFIFLISLLVTAYLLVTYFVCDNADIYTTDMGVSLVGEEVIVRRVVIFLCSLSLTVALGSVLFVFVLILVQEYQHACVDMSSSVPPSASIHTVFDSDMYDFSARLRFFWHFLLLFSSVSVLLLMPFAYLFSESEGISATTILYPHLLSSLLPLRSHTRARLMSRLHEACAVLFLLGILLIGLVYITYSLLHAHSSHDRMASFHWSEFLSSSAHLLHTCVVIGANCLLLLCACVGQLRAFDMIAGALFRLRARVGARYRCCYHTDSDVTARMQDVVARARSRYLSEIERCVVTPVTPVSTNRLRCLHVPADFVNNSGDHKQPSLSNGSTPHRGAGMSAGKLEACEHPMLASGQAVTAVTGTITAVTLCTVLVLSLTAGTCSLVVVNVLRLLLGLRSPHGGEAQIVAGLSGTCYVGHVITFRLLLFAARTFIQFLLVAYLLLVVFVGFYSLPGNKQFRPHPRATAVPLLVFNCACLQLISSALLMSAYSLGFFFVDNLLALLNIPCCLGLSPMLAQNGIYASVCLFCLLRRFHSTSRRTLTCALLCRARNHFARAEPTLEDE